MTDSLVHVDSLVALLASPAALCDSAGVIRVTNDAFEAWAGAALGARVDVYGSRGALLRPDRTLPLLLAPLESGGWLALSGAPEGHGANATVAASVAVKLERLEASLEANAQLGLLEGPSGPVARSLRESLALTEELRRLRRQVAALGATPASERLPVNIELLLREAARLLSDRPIRVTAPDADYTVEIDRSQLLPLLVGILADLASDLDEGATVQVVLRAGDFVRAGIESPATPGSDTPSMSAARTFLAANGGRMLLDPGVRVTLELPSFARGIRAGGGFGTVLIVDDDESTLAMMSAVLRRAGFRVLAAEDGVEASALLRQHIANIVAIVADAVLPGRSGVELAAEARRWVPELPVLLVSGHSSDLVGAAELGHLPILPKPFGARTLTDSVRAMLKLTDPRG